MKKIIYRVACAFILVVIMVGIYLYNATIHIKTYHSPEGNYELVIQRRVLDTFIPTMPGDGSSFTVEVVLKNADGKVIGKCKSTNDCASFNYSISVDWDFENNQVYYAVARTINLKTGKVEC